MSKTYFITLTPYQLYFFGGEQNEQADYFLRGTALPQQTALLGMIRYQILKQNNLLDNNNKIINDAKAVKWIGKNSFQYNERKQTFKKIESISHCYIVKQTSSGSKKYQPACPDCITGLKLLGENYFLPAYDAKKGYSIRWENVEDNTDALVESFYDEVERVGVDKNYTEKTDDDSFFKQVWCKMKNGFAFGFYLTVANNVIIKNADITLGKENSVFRMKVEDSALPKKQKNSGNAVVLTCDAFVKPSFFKKCDFAVCDTEPFRNLANKTNASHNHYGLHKHKKRLQLLRRGSVFIAKDIKNLISALKKESNFIKIGYNSFQIIQINITS